MKAALLKRLEHLEQVHTAEDGRPGLLLARWIWIPCEAPSETATDNAAYRGRSNGAQEVDIGMAELVSGNPSAAFARLWPL